MHHPKRPQRRPGRAQIGSLLLLLAGAGACQPQAGEDSTHSSQRIAGGTADVSHQDVFLIAWHEEQAGSLCTATLIAPNLLLTARHCVSPNAGDPERIECGDAGLGEPRPAESFVATNDPQPRQGSPFFRGRHVRVPGVGVDTCGYDIALIILGENVPAAISTPAIPRIDSDATPGEAYTAVGYGVTASGEPNGSRMQLGGLSVACPPGNCGDGVESTEFMGESGICSGDSGGPALDAKGRVLGVVSRGGPECTDPIYGSVAAWRDFIVETAEEAAVIGGYEAPFWVKTLSSDPPQTAGTGGAGAEPSQGAEGSFCKSGSDCSAGLVCYGPFTSSTASCTPSCTTSSDCSDGLVCKAVGGGSICEAASDSRDESSGCAVSAAPARAPGSGLLLASAAAFSLLRRRSAAAKPRS